MSVDVPRRPFRFGVQCPAFGDRSRLLATARAAEALGYDELFTADHLGAADPFVPLVVVAEATTTLRVGPLVLNNAFHEPALLARTVATLDAMSGGRVVLGWGTGYLQREHDAAGIPLDPPGPRVDRLDESLTVVRSLLDAGAATFEGRHHRVAVDDLGVRPQQARVPFLVGGHGRRVVGVAARHADVFQFTGLVHGPDGEPSPDGFDVRALVERSRWLTDAAGERAGSIERSALVQGVAVGPDVTAARRDVVARTGLDDDVIDTSPFVLMGSVEQLVDRLERTRELLGISHYVVRDPEAFAPVVDRLRGR